MMNAVRETGKGVVVSMSSPDVGKGVSVMGSVGAAPLSRAMGGALADL